jgi:hypothetical protein
LTAIRNIKTAINQEARRKQLVWIVSVLLGLLIAGIGTLGIVSPETLFKFFHQIGTPIGLYFAAGGRVILGISLLVSASNSRAPSALKVLGWVFLAAGLLLQIFGFEVFQSALYHFASLGPWAARIWGSVALGLGLYMAYAVVPRRRVT